MPIPVKADHDLAEIGTMADGILAKLNVIRFGKGCGPYQAKVNRESLREKLQEYVTAVMTFADGYENETAAGILQTPGPGKADARRKVRGAQ